jgi:radical SAM superfamily enzyme YgiQ (UPF0313 family)
MLKAKYKRILLVEANNQRKWIGSRVKMEMHIPPLGLLSLAAYVSSVHPDIEIRVIESSLDTPTGESYRQYLNTYKPDLVGIRGICFFEQEFEQIVAWSKAYGKMPVIGGGPIASARKEKLLMKIENLDCIVVGEGEIPFLRLVEGFRYKEIKGLFYKHENTIISTGSSEIEQDLDQLPTPDYRLVDHDKYEKHLSYAYNYRRQGVISSTRGCPFRCTYCNTFAGKTARIRSAEKIIADMTELWETHQVKDFYFIDDIFNVDKTRTYEVFKKIISNGFDWKLYFVNGIRADLMDRELIDLMVKAGTVWVTYGLESASPKIQKLIKKNLNIDKSFDMINYTQKKEIAVNINTMFGFPTETKEDARLTLEFIENLHRPSILPYHFCLRLYEGCAIVNQAEQAGWDISKLMADNSLSYNSFPNGTPSFSKNDMQDHLIEYHERFGIENQNHFDDSTKVLKNIGYTNRDLVDMYSILQNKEIADLYN